MSVNSTPHALYTVMMSAAEVHAGRNGSASLGSDGQLTTIGAGAATVNVAVQLSVLQSPVTVYVKLNAAPLQCGSAGKTGILALLSPSLQPPVYVNPATHVL